ncbi:hypothetical protein BDV96DRAFT_604468 [Lophiotrema nucula]|uniref:Uncharacterized protein n=1 Tax=Lophiotrema nucula TaxID=690887 RepID=A0A6A5YV89_9PLEO|nr:hypothetical protein BDV96DRAFT_604468 [Lophiotrema nucula]
MVSLWIVSNNLGYDIFTPSSGTSSPLSTVSLLAPLIVSSSSPSDAQNYAHIALRRYSQGESALVISPICVTGIAIAAFTTPSLAEGRLGDEELLSQVLLLQKRIYDPHPIYSLVSDALVSYSSGRLQSIAVAFIFEIAILLIYEREITKPALPWAATG